MSLRRTLAKRLYNKNRELLPNAAKTNFHHNFSTSPNYTNDRFFRWFLQRRAINQSAGARLPVFLSIPVGDKLKEKLKSINNVNGDRLRLDGLSPPFPVPSPSLDGLLSVNEAKKILNFSQLEKLRLALRTIPVNSISYSQYIQTCVDVCSNRDLGLEFAKKLDESGNVIVLGNIVLLRPEQVAKSVEKMISQSIAIPNDPRKKELEHMEKLKVAIDEKAQQLVQAELYCGLGFWVLQTLGLMRLTFWELSWDVMEPICFFLTSFHFSLAYAFFLRTSKEPSFEGYFQRRFKVKQKKLMEVHNFDVQKYNELCEAFYPNYYNVTNYGHIPGSRAFFGAMNG